ncbi:hypothetical protein BGW36DRAFT_294167 [Talaromyces proteolyticus]|uniref:NmrA-like domain-containing protein n=1 Tax=Talaromyces proteolyticus TaxID=1131652 RepID=A0AAD4Q140_9EURO|nr:uncharacterized protein BGW36DRAFT_294167 [Talaromyces proteolyticus]KAH8698339.1 hypothetical protein BGW36DRAFT_294167 [Talaromyces proteolyticus]
MSKLAVIIGVTGNQGGSVAQRFLQDSQYRVRGITRDPASAKAQELSSQGVEIVKADLEDVDSLVAAFHGANVIFSVTNYWEPFFRPDHRQAAADAGISIRQHAYNVEHRQGQNIADAAATVLDSLDHNGFLASTLSHAKKSSNGVYEELYHFDAKADIFPYYVQEKWPQLAAKASYIQTGFFTRSYKLVPTAYFQKQPDGSRHMLFPTDPDSLIPHLEVNRDIGNFVYAVSKMPPRKHYMAEGTTCSWTEYIRLFTSITGISAQYKQTSLADMIEAVPDREFGREVGDMLLYSTDPGYDGGDKTLLKATDIRKAGIDCPMTSLEEWMKLEDWSVLGP